MNYHLVGMGVLGSFFAWELYRAKKAFTWNDTEEAHCAWKASTGLIYPCGNAEEMKAYRAWSLWHQRGAPWTAAIGRYSEAGAFWFLSKHPPHEGKYDVLAHVGPLYLGAYPSYHLDVQRFVRATRTFFADRRIEGVARGAQEIVAHGFTPICDHYVWGWSRRVQLLVDEHILFSTPTRPTFYLRSQRFQFAYANLVPRSSYHYAGSATLVQKHYKHYALEEKYTAWKALFSSLTDGLVTVAKDDEPLCEGWRPAMQEQRKPHLYHYNHRYYVPAMGGSGVRLAPLLCAHLRSLLCT